MIGPSDPIMDDRRSRAKVFFNHLDPDRPINFGLDELIAGAEAQPEQLYVESIHDSDPAIELAAQIDFSPSAGAYLFTGNHGTGKTTELMRLGRILINLGCEVFYVDLDRHLSLARPIGITDLLISMLKALLEQVNARFGVEIGEPRLEEEMHVHELVSHARRLVLEVVDLVRKRRGDPNMKVVLIADSINRLRGSGMPEQIHAVLQSAVQLFSSCAHSLRFTGMSVVYTVPPYLQALAGQLGSLYAGGRVYTLPSALCANEGEARMLAIVAKRYPSHSEFFSDAQLRRLAHSAAGNLRDFFRMLRLAIVGASRIETRAADAVLMNVEDAVRCDMLPIAADDRDSLRRIDHEHRAALPSSDELPRFARLQQGKYILQYRNGEDRFTVHPLLRKALAR